MRTLKENTKRTRNIDLTSEMSDINVRYSKILPCELILKEGTGIVEILYGYEFFQFKTKRDALTWLHGFIDGLLVYHNAITYKQP